MHFVNALPCITEEGFLAAPGSEQKKLVRTVTDRGRRRGVPPKGMTRPNFIPKELETHRAVVVGGGQGRGCGHQASAAATAQVKTE